MGDEPENLTLKIFRELRAEMREGFEKARAERAEMRAEQQSLARLVGKVTDAVTQIATTQDHHGEVLARHSEVLGKLYEIQLNNGARLNVIEGRLAIIEKHTGLVKA